MANKVVICGVNTATLPKLSEQKTVALLTEIKKGNESAREEFIVCNMRLVLSIIKRFHLKNANSDDVFQAGCIGLIKAIDNFDFSHDIAIITYNLQ
jgi:RNA polymerase sporulation-specific sigma factor